jgi:hypothetical protein
MGLPALDYLRTNSKCPGLQALLRLLIFRGLELHAPTVTAMAKATAVSRGRMFPNRRPIRRAQDGHPSIGVWLRRTGNGKGKRWWGKGVRSHISKSRCGVPERFGLVEENRQRRWGEGVRSPTIARSGGFRMGHPAVLWWVEGNGQLQKRSSVHDEHSSTGGVSFCGVRRRVGGRRGRC